MSLGSKDITFPGESVSIPAFTMPWGIVAPGKHCKEISHDDEELQPKLTRKYVATICGPYKRENKTCRVSDRGAVGNTTS